MTELGPALSCGYSERVLAQLPKVRREADNATAAAFRSAQTCVVRGSDLASGALAVPLMTPIGCVGVLAIELRRGSEQQPRVRAIATIVAAQLARLVEASRPAETADRRLA
jgi:GAF domain-containing protein